MGWGPVDWVGRVLPEAKFEKKCTLFFYFFYLSDRYCVTYFRTNGLTWVSARDTTLACLKNGEKSAASYLRLGPGVE